MKALLLVLVLSGCVYGDNSSFISVTATKGSTVNVETPISINPNVPVVVGPF